MQAQTLHNSEIARKVIVFFPTVRKVEAIFYFLDCSKPHGFGHRGLWIVHIQFRTACASCAPDCGFAIF